MAKRLSVPGADQRRFKVEADGREYAINPANFVLIDVDVLKDEFTDQANRFSWIASLHARVTKELHVREALLRATEAKIYKEIRDVVPPKTTETAIKHDIVLDPRFASELKNVRELQYVVDELKALMKSMEHRRDMLQQLGPYQRKEMEFYEDGFHAGADRERKGRQ